MKCHLDPQDSWALDSPDKTGAGLIEALWDI